MATYWVSTLAADDTNNGTTYALAKKTIAAGLALIAAKGDVLNIVNDGTHAWPTARTDVGITAGTSYSDPSCIIQGTDTAGVIAKTTIAPTAAAAHYFVRFRDPTAYTITQNLIFDATSQQADANAYIGVEWRDTTPPQGPHKVRYCDMLGAASGAMAGGIRTLASYQSAQNNADQGTVEHCYVQNAGTSVLTQGGYQRECHNCVFINDSGNTRANSILSWENPGVAETTRIQRFYNCTIYDDSGSDNGAAVVHFTPSVLGSHGEVSVYSNVYWTDTTGTIGPLMHGSNVAGITHTGNINWNVMLGGPNVAIGDLTAEGWYGFAWDPVYDDLVAPDTYGGDVTAFGVEDTTVFNDPSSTYDWVLPNGLTTTILKDLRLVKYQTAGRYGAAPGALGAYSTSDGDPEDPDDASAIPTLDVMPFYTPVMRLEMNMRLETKMNRERKHYLRSDTEDKGWREYTSRRESVGAGITKQVFSGIETGSFLLMEADNAVAVNAGAEEDVWLPDAKVVAARGGNYSYLKLKNNSGTDVAKTLTVMVD